MTDMSKLTEKRKADRIKMATILHDNVVAAGGTCEIVDWAKKFGHPSRRIMCEIVAPGGAEIWVSFDGDTSQPDTYVATWNTRGKLWINPAMGPVNPHHWSKLNRVGYGFEHLVNIILNDIETFASGDGYLSEDNWRIQAMKKSYEERGWPWYPNEEEE